MLFSGIIQRMILGELLKIFFVALVGLTGIILLAGIISEAMRNGLGPMQIIACVPLLLPSLLPYTVPTTTLFATCIVYGRLSSDNEILALKTAGVHIVHVIWPALLLGIAASVVTMFFFLDFIPRTGFLLRSQVIGDVEDLLYTALRREGSIRKHNLDWEIHVNGVDGKKLQDVIFKRRSADGEYDIVARAREAELRVDLAHKVINVHMRDCHITQRDGAVAYFESRIWPVDIVGEWGPGPIKVRASEMTWLELFEYDAKLRKEKEDLSREIDLQQAGQNLVGAAKDTAKIDALNRERKFKTDIINAIQAEWCMRPALALGCLCFALVGCPVGIWFSKSDYLSAFITCFLPIVIVYYPLMFCMFDLSRFGKIPPWMGVFNADALVLLVGSVLFSRLSRN
jgi:lipopolysaccharide export system permease protein